jgi:hypothetical protein
MRSNSAFKLPPSCKRSDLAVLTGVLVGRAINDCDPTGSSDSPLSTLTLTRKFACHSLSNNKGISGMDTDLAFFDCIGSRSGSVATEDDMFLDALAATTSADLRLQLTASLQLELLVPWTDDEVTCLQLRHKRI